MTGVRPVFLELEMGGGRSLDWFHTTVDARRRLSNITRRMGCERHGNGTTGKLVKGDRVLARYIIGMEV